jgi:hypothetical protein
MTSGSDSSFKGNWSGFSGGTASAAAEEDMADVARDPHEIIVNVLFGGWVDAPQRPKQFAQV